MNNRYAHNRRKNGGFTLAELLVGMMVTAIILGAVASLAYAFTSAQSSTDNMSEKQTVLRFTTFRISDAIKNSNQLRSASATQLDFWADDNGDGVIDLGEEFSIETDGTGNSLIFSDQQGDAVLLEDCTNVRFLVDVAAPLTRMVSIMFDLTEDGVVCNRQIRAALRCSAEHYAGGG